jgi:integrase
MCTGSTQDGAKQMAAVIQLPQTSKWAKRGKQPPIRQPNQASRTREYLTPDEVEQMITAARHVGGRLAERDALLIMTAYRHGLRASELIALRWDQIELKAGTLHVARLKHGSPSTHPLRGPELRALRAWKREQGDADAVRVHVASRRPDNTAHRPSRCRGSRQSSRHRVSGSSAHAPARNRLLSGERRPRYSRDSDVPRSQEHSAHRQIHRVIIGPLQRFLERLTMKTANKRKRTDPRGAHPCAAFIATPFHSDQLNLEEANSSRLQN